MRHPETQGRIQAAISHGFQTRDAEMDLARMLATWLFKTQRFRKTSGHKSLSSLAQEN